MWLWSSVCQFFNKKNLINVFKNILKQAKQTFSARHANQTRSLAVDRRPPRVHLRCSAQVNWLVCRTVVILHYIAFCNNCGRAGNNYSPTWGTRYCLRITCTLSIRYKALSGTSTVYHDLWAQSFDKKNRKQMAVILVGSTF